MTDDHRRATTVDDPEATLSTLAGLADAATAMVDALRAFERTVNATVSAATAALDQADASQAVRELRAAATAIDRMALEIGGRS